MFFHEKELLKIGIEDVRLPVAWLQRGHAPSGNFVRRRIATCSELCTTRERKSGYMPSAAFLEHLWMGHADEEAGDLYSRLKEDESYRQHWVERIGLRFAVGTLGQLNVVSISKVKVA